MCILCTICSGGQCKTCKGATGYLHDLMLIGKICDCRCNSCDKAPDWRPCKQIPEQFRNEMISLKVELLQETINSNSNFYNFPRYLIQKVLKIIINGKTKEENIQLLPQFCHCDLKNLYLVK